MDNNEKNFFFLLSDEKKGWFYLKKKCVGQYARHGTGAIFGVGHIDRHGTFGWVSECALKEAPVR